MATHKMLKGSQSKVLEVFADTIIPASEKIPFKHSQLKIAERIEEFTLGYSSKNVILVFRFVLSYIQYRAPFFKLCFKRFTEMDEKLRESYLESIYHSPLGV